MAGHTRPPVKPVTQGMASMTTSTSHIDSAAGVTPRIDARRRCRGFTLIELTMATTIASMVMTGVLSSFVLMGKNGYNAANYSMMEAESRRALETFTREARMANNITWTSANSVTLSVVDGVGTYNVSYAYDPSTAGSTARTFYRQPN